MRQEMPQHLVEIGRPFGLGKYPVTLAEFADFVQETGYRPGVDCSVEVKGRYFRKGVGSWQDTGYIQTFLDPVVCVSIRDAAAYIDWLNAKVQKSRTAKGAGPYRLPTEAEWEYAARAGTQTAYWWGNTIGSNNTVCLACGSRWDHMQPAPVDSFLPNQFGLYDMLGNVEEPTADCWNPSFASAPSDGTAWRSGDCEKTVARGGTWASDPWSVRVTSRRGLALRLAGNVRGFRVAKQL